MRMGTEFFWFYDVLLIAVLLGGIMTGYKQGFVKMLLSLCTFLIAFVGALILSGAIANAIYDNVIEKPLTEEINKIVYDTVDSEVLEGISELDLSKTTVNGQSVSSLDAKPDDAGKITLILSSVDISKTGAANIDLSAFGVTNVDYSNINVGTVQVAQADAEKYGLEKIVFAQVITTTMKNTESWDSIVNASQSVSELLASVGVPEDVYSNFADTFVTNLILGALQSAENPGKQFLDDFAKPIIFVPMQTIIFIVLFILLLIIMAVITATTKIVNKIPLVGGLNQFLGGVFGLLQGVLSLFVIVIVVHLIVSATGNSLIFLNEMTISKSYVFSYVYNFEFLNFIS